jgi:hypothetical protein
MFAWILNTKPVSEASVGATSRVVVAQVERGHPRVVVDRVNRSARE